jgi:CysZ protein
MKISVKAVHKSIALLKEDKIILLLSFIPVVVGIAAYYYLGNLFYVDFLNWGKELVAGNVGEGQWMSVLSWLFTAILTVILYFLVSWTFVLFVSLIASPFNDIISGRVERRLLNKSSEEITSEKFFSKLVKILINELKKVVLIIILSIFAFVVGLFFPPLAFVISALLLAISFLDYAWSRKELTFSECLANVKKSFFSYLISGCAFMALISIPILNLFVLPFAVIYYSVVYYSKENELVI